MTRQVFSINCGDWRDKINNINIVQLVGYTWGILPGCVPCVMGGQLKSKIFNTQF